MCFYLQSSTFGKTLWKGRKKKNAFMVRLKNLFSPVEKKVEEK